EVGQVVDISTVVGEVGSTGRSTGPHLHLELKNSDYVSFDPVLWLQTRQMRLETS
ncbi:M23 family metallopeptidase, partial [Escherichia coli]